MSMFVYLAALVAFVLAAAGMSIGLLFGRAQIKGHCGGSPPDACNPDGCGHKVATCVHCDCEG